MHPDPIAAAGHLADVLDAENAALLALDVPGATALLPAKERAAAALAHALAHTRPAPGDDGPAPGDDGPARDVAARLDEAARENRRLLERAMRVQGQVIGALARAVQQAGAQEAPRYGRRGSLASAGAGRALSSRA